MLEVVISYFFRIKKSDENLLCRLSQLHFSLQIGASSDMCCEWDTDSMFSFSLYIW